MEIEYPQLYNNATGQAEWGMSGKRVSLLRAFVCPRIACSPWSPPDNAYCYQWTSQVSWEFINTLGFLSETNSSGCFEQKGLCNVNGWESDSSGPTGEHPRLHQQSHSQDLMLLYKFLVHHSYLTFMKLLASRFELGQERHDKCTGNQMADHTGTTCTMYLTVHSMLTTMHT